MKEESENQKNRIKHLRKLENERFKEIVNKYEELKYG